MARVAGNKADKHADDLGILHPDATVQVGDETITVREYGFVEGLRLRPVMAPLQDALGALVDAEGEGLTVDHVMGLLAEHYQATMELLAVAIDKPVEWLNGLNQKEGADLMMVWWGVNGPFFVRSVLSRKAAGLLARHRQNLASAGATSTPPSSPTATGPTSSAPTQSDN